MQGAGNHGQQNRGRSLRLLLIACEIWLTATLVTAGRYFEDAKDVTDALEFLTGLALVSSLIELCLYRMDNNQRQQVVLPLQRGIQHGGALVAPFPANPHAVIVINGINRAYFPVPRPQNAFVVNPQNPNRIVRPNQVAPALEMGGQG